MIDCSYDDCEEEAVWYDEMDNPICESHRILEMAEDESLEPEDYNEIY